MARERSRTIAGLVQSGKLAAALIPARAWDELGVTSLQALQAPFLVSTEELLEQIVQGEPAEEMLAGLDKAGVVGLALLPEGLRHPVGFARPLLTLEDFAGAKIRAPLSNASYRLLEALAAKPVELCCVEFSQAVAAGRSTEQNRASRGEATCPAGHVHRQRHLLPEGERHRRERRYVRRPQRRAPRNSARGCRQDAQPHAQERALRTGPGQGVLPKRRHDRIRIRSRRGGSSSGRPSRSTRRWRRTRRPRS